MLRDRPIFVIAWQQNYLRGICMPSSRLFWIYSITFGTRTSISTWVLHLYTNIFTLYVFHNFFSSSLAIIIFNEFVYLFKKKKYTNTHNKNVQQLKLIWLLPTRFSFISTFGQWCGKLRALVYQPLFRWFWKHIVLREVFCVVCLKNSRLRYVI